MKVNHGNLRDDFCHLDNALGRALLSSSHTYQVQCFVIREPYVLTYRDATRETGLTPWASSRRRHRAWQHFERVKGEMLCHSHLPLAKQKLEKSAATIEIQNGHYAQSYSD